MATWTQHEFRPKRFHAGDGRSRLAHSQSFHVVAHTVIDAGRLTTDHRKLFRSSRASLHPITAMMRITAMMPETLRVKFDRGARGLFAGGCEACCHELLVQSQRLAAGEGERPLLDSRHRRHRTTRHQ
eukprot:2850175-Rhodomonas_salina.1